MSERPPPLTDTGAADLLDRFAAALSHAEAAHLDAVRGYVAWQAERGEAGFAPSGDDDVDLRTYLLERRIAGTPRDALESIIAALKRFYAWAEAEGQIDYNPFDEFNFDRPLLSRDQIRRRQDSLGGDPQAREIARLRALNRLSEHLNRTTDLQDALDVALETLVEIMGLHTAWVFLWTEADLPAAVVSVPQPHDFALSAACALPPGLESNHQYHLRQPPDCHCQYLMREGWLKRAVNVVECTRLLASEEEASDNQGLLYHATVPLLAQGRPFGILNIATDEWQFFSAADLQLLSAVGAQVAVAIERARLFAQSAELGAAEERNRLAREIHDTLAQGLAAISMQLETADVLLDAGADPARVQQAVQQALALTRANLDEARRSVLDLRAAPLEGRTLTEALTALVAEWSAKWSVPARLEVAGPQRALPHAVETSLYRIAQEALSNVARHAAARHVVVRLTMHGAQAQLDVEDDGRGFDAAHIPPGRYGLIGLNERARLLGGSLVLESTPDEGTRIEVTIPLERRG
jgi:two-component system NarL family sensor kinase